MSRIFIGLYLDEDVDVLIADLIKAHGFFATTTRDEDQLGSSDSDQLAYALSQQKTLLTHNRTDFEMLAQAYFESGQTHYGIIIAVRHPPHEVVRRLLLILNQVTFDEM